MYVISQDAHLLLQEWANKRGFIVPQEVESTTEKLVSYLRQIFPVVELVSASELQDGMIDLIQGTGMVSVSLDRVYCHSSLHVDITRAVYGTKEDAGLIARHGFKSLSEQACGLKNILQGQHEVALIDDVIFSGGLLSHLINLLEEQGIYTSLVIAGVAVGEGVEVLQKRGVEVRAVRVFSTVIDEICERDFLPGVPLSGRTVVENDKVGAPYILPFGRPHEWASIPRMWERKFSNFCLNLSADVFDAIGQASDRQVFPRDLERCPLGISASDSRSFAVILRALADTVVLSR